VGCSAARAAGQQAEPTRSVAAAMVHQVWPAHSEMGPQTTVSVEDSKRDTPPGVEPMPLGQQLRGFETSAERRRNAKTERLFCR